MWAIKVLNGPQAGRIFQMPVGNHTLGRSQQASIRVASKSVSKVHAQIIVTEDKVIISDHQSSNGVFVNGVKVQNKVLKAGDKFALSDTIFDVIKLPNYVSFLPEMNDPKATPQVIGSNALATQSAPQPMVSYEEEAAGPLATSLNTNENEAQVAASQLSIPEKFENYIDEVALPGVYEYSNKFDLKYVIMSFVLFFIVLVTILSLFPVIRISQDFVVDESQRRAESLAKLLVQTNRQYILDNNEVSVSINIIRNETGVEKAFIIDAQDGHIIAPVNKRGRYSKIPFLQRARKKAASYSEVMSEQIGVSKPILYNNPLTGEPSAKAYAIVLYNMNQVALDIPRAISLMINILIITLIAGGVLYFFLYKVITKPLYDLNEEMDKALKEGNNSIELVTPTPIFQRLVANINSSLSRMGVSEDDGPSVAMGDKSMEASEVVNMFPVAAIAISPETDMFIATNDYLNGHPLFNDEDLLDKYVDDLTDPSLIESLRDLIEKANGNPNQKHHNILPTQDNEKFDVAIKSIQENGTVSYYIICFTEIYDEEGLE
ncbi:MAG: FHA domain-containing protein [Bdellovibrionales bacterium]|nr:FHA domain-containing protein [Bdellovibrionales bacterium]NQZ17811.1 FHA domain-containing protein [Bdellovibrionales bacterium]